MSKKTLVIILGNLTAFGPFVTDFYLPCLPKLTSYFPASASLIQVSLTATEKRDMAAALLGAVPVRRYCGTAYRTCKYHPLHGIEHYSVRPRLPMFGEAFQIAVQYRNKIFSR